MIDSRNKVLQMSSGLEYPGGMRWDLVACLMCAWILVYFAIWKSIKSSAKVRYFTATLPFMLIIIFLGRAVTLDGAQFGLRYFFRPNWSELANANVWINAAAQNFNSLGIAFGSMISFASYNKYNNNFLHDTLAVSFVNAITSLLVGIFAFATIGNIALEQNTSVENVITDGIFSIWFFFKSIPFVIVFVVFRPWIDFRCLSTSNVENAIWTNVGGSILLHATLSWLKQSGSFVVFYPILCAQF